MGGVRKTTLWDFQQFSAIQESARLGEVLKKSLSAAREVHESALRQAPLAELAGLTVPAAAVEFEFLGDAAAEGVLKDPAFQSRMAKLLMESIRKLFVRLLLRRSARSHLPRPERNRRDRRIT